MAVFEVLHCPFTQIDRIARAEFRRLGQCSLKQKGQRQLGDCGAKRLSLALAAFCLLWPSTATAQVEQIRRVLVFTQGNLSSPGVAAFDREFSVGLKKSPYAIERYSEHTETVLFPRDASHRKLREWYQNRKPDVIIAAGPFPIKFLVESHEELFGDTPIVFCGSSEEQADNPKLDSDFTGVWMPIDPAKTLDAALQLQPSTQHVVVVGGMSPYDKRLEAIARDQLRSYESKVEFEYLTDLAMPALLERLRHLPNNTLVLYTSLTTDAAGRDFIPATESLPMVISVANAPVFALADTLIGQGTVGGYVVSFATQGKLAAAIATRVLQGERPQDIPIVRDANVFIFDWRALRRWGFKESALPPNSTVLNRQPTIWESYKWYIVGVIALSVAEALLILGLLWQRARRRKVEAELAIAYDRLHSALESGRAVAWEWNLESGKDSWFGDLKTMFGIPSDTYVGRPEDFHRFVHPDDRQQVSEAVAEARKNHQAYVAEFRVVWPDGTLRWVTATGKFYYSPNGEPKRMLGTAVDITYRKLSEASLQELSGRLIHAQEAERARIARELHDDLSQRVALLQIGLEQFEQDTTGLPSKARQQLLDIAEVTREVSSNIHDLSHQLHPFKLDTLGLVVSLGGFCREFSEQHHIQVQFGHHDISGEIPKDVTLCLFRIAQEALRNVVKHSGAAGAKVELSGHGHEIDLRISDSGVGFDPESVKADGGLGLISMRERLRLVRGHLVVESEPSRGTRIRVRVPLPTSNTGLTGDEKTHKAGA
jgi:PAS domain S-box-containing protein